MAFDNATAGNSAEYKRNRPLVLARDNYTCQINDIMCTKVAEEVDHIKNQDSGGSDAMENLQAVCRKCHARKTSLEQWRKRQKNKRDAKHPWSRMKHPGIR